MESKPSLRMPAETAVLSKLAIQIAPNLRHDPSIRILRSNESCVLTGYEIKLKRCSYLHHLQRAVETDCDLQRSAGRPEIGPERSSAPASETAGHLDHPERRTRYRRILPRHHPPADIQGTSRLAYRVLHIASCTSRLGTQYVVRPFDPLIFANPQVTDSMSPDIEGNLIASYCHPAK